MYLYPISTREQTNKTAYSIGEILQYVQNSLITNANLIELPDGFKSWKYKNAVISVVNNREVEMLAEQEPQEIVRTQREQNPKVQ